MKPSCSWPFFAVPAAGVALVVMLLAPAGGCRTSTRLPPHEVAAPVPTVVSNVTSTDPGPPGERVVEQPSAAADPLEAGPPETPIPPAASPDPTLAAVGDGSTGDAPPAGPDAAGDVGDAPPAGADAVPGLDAVLPGLADLDLGDLLPAAQPVSAVEAKLDGVLLELVRARRADGEAGVRAYVELRKPELSPDRLRVEIVCESPEDAAAVRELVETAGGAVTTSFDNHLWAEVALASVETLAEAAAVWTIALDRALFAPQGR